MTNYPAEHAEPTTELVSATPVVTWPTGNFVENIAILPNGDFVVSVHNKREIHIVTLAGERRLWAATPESPAGLVVTRDHVFAVAGEPGVGPHRLLKLTLAGTIEDSFTVPDTLFLNGFTPGRAGRAYAVDSLMGVVIEVDLNAMTSEVVLRDALLAKSSDEPMLPGANGIKVGDDGIYISNTDRALILRAPFGLAGLTGKVEIVAEHLRGDDFAIDADGALYIATHIHNSLIRLRRNGERRVVAGAAEGMAGSTACIFHPEDPDALYVTATGGVIMPLDGVVQEAKLVRLAIGARGRPFGF